MGKIIPISARLAFSALLIPVAAPLSAQETLPDPIAFSVQTPPPPRSSKENGVALPAMGRIEVFDDWAVGCDNRLACSAVSLLPDETSGPYAMLMIISREGGAGTTAQIQFLSADPLGGKVDLIADGKRLAQIESKPDGVELAGDAALPVIRTLGQSFAFSITQRKQVLVRPSLLGLSSALRFMDRQQGRAGARDALGMVGDSDPANARVAPPALPDVTTSHAQADAAGASGPAPLSADEEAAARKIAICEGIARANAPLELNALDADHQLVLVPCDAEAYNVSFVPLIAWGLTGSRSFAIARFDAMPGFTGEPGTPPLVVNARWNPSRSQLSSFTKGRGLGDCGAAEDYLWDGEQFRLEEARAMPVCRGAWEWPRIFSRK